MKKVIKGILTYALVFCLLTVQGLAVTITPSTEKVTLTEGESRFSIDLSLTNDAPFAGAEFGLALGEGVSFVSATILDSALRSATEIQKVEEGIVYFGFISDQNRFEGTYAAFRLTFTYSGTGTGSLWLEHSQVATIQADNTATGDTSGSGFTVTVLRSDSGGGSGGNGGSSGGSGSESGAGSAGRGSTTGSSETVGDEGIPLSAQNPFSDLEHHWSKDEVLRSVALGLFNGTSETAFSPDLPITRGMLVTVLHRMEGEPESGAPVFTDVNPAMYYAPAIAWAADREIVNGMGDGTFQPDSNITREQMAAILYRYAAGKNYDVTATADLSRYTDSGTISAYASPALSWANAKGIMNGDTESTLAPQGTATRAEAACVLIRFLDQYAPL